MPKYSAERAKKWVQQQKAKGFKFELTPQYSRNCWKKYKGRDHYFHYPISRAGYESALLGWIQLKATIDRDRPHADVYHHHIELFEAVHNWYERFGVPTNEKKLAIQVGQFIEWVLQVLQQPELTRNIPWGGDFASEKKRREFWVEFVENHPGYMLGASHYVLPPKWEERLRQLDESPRKQKKPQTIDFWLEQYIERVKDRARHTIRARTAYDRNQRLNTFRKFADTSKHITTIDSHLVEDFYHHLASSNLAKDTKDDRLGAFRMFVSWASKQKDCELVRPDNLDSREFVFREPKGTGRKRLEKKQLLWTKEEFDVALKNVPQPHRSYLVLMLNCGFRSSDLNHLRKSDLHLDEGRLIIQREKMNQNDSSPVVNYLLWDKSVELIKGAMCEDEVYAFTNSRGGRLIVDKIDENGKVSTYDNLSRYWTRKREDFGLVGKRLDFIRKTGSTAIEKINRGLEALYLGESLKSVPRIHYNFNDGEVFTELDEAIMEMGVQFGFCEKPKEKKVKLSPKLLTSLAEKAEEQGMTIEELIEGL